MRISGGSLGLSGAKWELLEMSQWGSTGVTGAQWSSIGVVGISAQCIYTKRKGYVKGITFYKQFNGKNI